MKNIIIVGGGTAGLISALIIKRRFDKINIKVIKSKELGIIGVGESSTEHWTDFTRYLGFNKTEIFQKTDCTYKTGVYFKNWTPKDYMHVVEGNFHDVFMGQAKVAFNHIINKYLNSGVLIHDSLKDNSLDNTFVPNQMHFNTFKLNEYLLEKCKVMNVEVIEDTIEEVTTSEKGIDSLKSKTNVYQADFYVDSTGFKRLLINKLGAKWIPFDKYLTVNHAIAFPTGDTEEYPPYTQSIAMNAGWMWRIPVWGRWGNGYVFNDNFINADEAKKEAEAYLGHSIEIAKDIKFQSGRIDKMWIKNCATSGLSSSFLEPLEATSIGTAIQQTYVLINNLINYNQSSIDFYNQEMDTIHQNMLDFVFLSYMVKKDNTDFWKMVNKLKAPDSLLFNLERWKARLPIRSDFKSDYCLFFDSNYIVKLFGLNLLNLNSVKEEYNSYLDNFKGEFAAYTESKIAARRVASVFKNKELVSKIRQNQCPVSWPL